MSLEKLAARVSSVVVVVARARHWALVLALARGAFERSEPAMALAAHMNNLLGRVCDAHAESPHIFRCPSSETHGAAVGVDFPARSPASRTSTAYVWCTCNAAVSVDRSGLCVLASSVHGCRLL